MLVLNHIVNLDPLSNTYSSPNVLPALPDLSLPLALDQILPAPQGMRCVCLRAYTTVVINIRMCTYTQYLYIHIHIHTYIHIHIYTYTYVISFTIYVYIYVPFYMIIYIYIHICAYIVCGHLHT